MSTTLLWYPLLVPFGAALLALTGGHRVARTASLAGALGNFVISLILVAATDTGEILVNAAGTWPAPFGIALVADRFSAAVLAACAAVALTASIFKWADPAHDGVPTPKLAAAFNILLLGVNGAFLTADLFNLYVWFEVLLVASFVLLVGRRQRIELRGAIPYIVINLIGSTCFLIGTGLLYARTGTLNFADLGIRLEAQPVFAGAPAAAMLLVAFGMKAAVFPFLAWLPPAYPAPTFAVAGLFAGLLTKVGFYALTRALTMVFPDLAVATQDLLITIAVLTMVVGVLGAAAQHSLRPILGFHIVSQIGYLIWGVFLLTPAGFAGAIFYLVHHIIVKANLFFIAGLVKARAGSEDLNRPGGLWRTSPWLSLLLLIPAFSLAGVPPLSGFWAKLAVIQAGLEIQAWWSTGAALVVGLLTLYSMTKIWNETIWKEPSDPSTLPLPRPVSRPAFAACAFLALITLGFGFGIIPLAGFAERAAEQLANPSMYREAVLGLRSLP